MPSAAVLDMHFPVDLAAPPSLSRTREGPHERLTHTLATSIRRYDELLQFDGRIRISISVEKVPPHPAAFKFAATWSQLITLKNAAT